MNEINEITDNRKYPCPNCETGELYDDGSMFMATILCNNPDCDYRYTDYYNFG